MDAFLAGLQVTFTPEILLLVLAGTVLGIVVGALPGISGSTTTALLLPLTIMMSPIAALAFLGSIYCAANFGGSITAILVNVPGEASSAVTCIDGYAMARQGRAQLALSVAALSSFAGGTVGTVLVAIAAQPLSRLASYVQAADYSSLMVFGLVAAVLASRSSPVIGGPSFVR